MIARDKKIDEMLKLVELLKQDIMDQSGACFPRVVASSKEANNHIVVTDNPLRRASTKDFDIEMLGLKKRNVNNNNED